MKPKRPFLVRPAEPAIDLDGLARATPGELQRIYRLIFDCGVPAANSALARRRIAWRLQTEKEGGLPASARQHALAIAREAGRRIRLPGNASGSHPIPHATVTGLVSDHDPRVPMPGSVIVKEYRGRTIVVHVFDSGFECEGQRFSSLSAIAKEITGTKWNGLLFFGLTKGRARGR